MRVAGGEPGRLAVAGTGRLADATFAMWPPTARLPAPLREPTLRLVACCAAPRPPEGPAAKVSLGALLVASAQLDVFLLAGVGAVGPCRRGADRRGGWRTVQRRQGRALDLGAALFTNGRLHSQVMGYLTSQER